MNEIEVNRIEAGRERASQIASSSVHYSQHCTLQVYEMTLLVLIVSYEHICVDILYIPLL